ncbi:MAG: rhodanese-like domain-containing protein [Desulfobulbus sp.]|nr:rhodanese-like domain-containing protein [Desulfobulbus sp.]
MDKSLLPEDLTGLLASGDNVTLLDVRRKEDFDKSPQTIANAEWKNPSEIDQWLLTIPAEQEVIVYCVRGGSVSQSVQQRLAEAGLKAKFIEGGLVALNKAI